VGVSGGVQGRTGDISLWILDINITICSRFIKFGCYLFFNTTSSVGIVRSRTQAMEFVYVISW
jgi:hypothetical protein